MSLFKTIKIINDEIIMIKWKKVLASAILRLGKFYEAMGDWMIMIPVLVVITVSFVTLLSFAIGRFPTAEQFIAICAWRCTKVILILYFLIYIGWEINHGLKRLAKWAEEIK